LERKDIFQAIELERERQEQLHPMPILRKVEDNKDISLIQNLILQNEMLAVLIEEVGEVGTALQGEGDLKEELIQVASVCTRWLENLK
jgi:hypothetical protein